MWLVCGLGNPGDKYKNTRHNVGFNIIDSIIKKNKIDLYKKDKNKELYKGSLDGYKCLFCKPLTFMNLSGKPILEIINFFKVSHSNVIIIHDDLDLKLGKIKVKIGGGNGGHNGLLNIDNIIGKKYKRLRLGISHPGNKNLVESYVLDKFTRDEKKIIETKINLITQYFSLLFENENLFLTRTTI